MHAHNPESHHEKLNRAKALVATVLDRLRRRAPDQPTYLSHLIWCEAKGNRALQWALIRIACHHIGHGDLSSSAQKEG